MNTTGRTSTPPAGPGHSSHPGSKPADHSSAPHARRETLRDESDAPETTEELGATRPSLWLALKSLGTAARTVTRALGRSALVLWRAIHWLIRGLLIWAGIPIAVGIFGLSASYHLLGFYLEVQADAIKQGQVQIAALRKERRALKEKLQAALAEADKAKDEAKKAREAATKQSAGDEPDVLRSQFGAGGRGDAAARPSKKEISMPCDLAGPAAGYQAKLSQCLKQYNKKLSSG